MADTGEFGHSNGAGFGHTPFGHAGLSPDPVVEVTAFGRRYRYGQQWGECSRCGFHYPFSELRIQPGDRGGMIVCTTMCLDDPSVLDLLPDELPTERPLLFIDEGGPSL